MTNTDLHKIDRELAEALGYVIENRKGTDFWFNPKSTGKTIYDHHFDSLPISSVSAYSPTTDPVQFIKLQMEYKINVDTWDDAWAALIEGSKQQYGADPMIAGCLALIEALKEK